jgi:hypothetical protein
MNKIFLYIFGIISVLIFSLQSFFYYAFSGGIHTKEFITGVLLLFVSFISISALFFLKNHPGTAGKIFISSGVLALIIMSARIGNPIFLFSESIIGMILVITPLVFLAVGYAALNYSVKKPAV